MGKKRVAWNKGKGKGWVDKRGYRWIYVVQDGHRRAKRLHRYIMEQHLGRILEPWEIVHHKDENLQNNTIENLELTTHSKHTLGHHINTTRPEATKKAMAVFAQLREEIHHLRRVKDDLQSVNADLLEACEKLTELVEWYLDKENFDHSSPCSCANCELVAKAKTRIAKAKNK